MISEECQLKFSDSLIVNGVQLYGCVNQISTSKALSKAGEPFRRLRSIPSILSVQRNSERLMTLERLEDARQIGRARLGDSIGSVGPGLLAVSVR